MILLCVFIGWVVGEWAGWVIIYVICDIIIICVVCRVSMSMSFANAIALSSMFCHVGAA